MMGERNREKKGEERIRERERERERNAEEKERKLCGGKVQKYVRYPTLSYTEQQYATLPNTALHYTPDYKEVLRTTQH